MRTIKELLVILRDNIDMLETGLCLLAVRLQNDHDITIEECIKIKAYIDANKPSKRSKFYSKLSTIYYWPSKESADYNESDRINWLNYHIKYTKHG